MSFSAFFLSLVLSLETYQYTLSFRCPCNHVVKKLKVGADLIDRATQHSIPSLANSRASSHPSISQALYAQKVELQSDPEFGRGEAHLSAILEEGDVVAYQVGTWTVDGVEVGDGTPARILLAKVDHTQIVWTHNCEHGCIRGSALELSDDGNKVNLAGVRRGNPVAVVDVEFGPEQLVARLPVRWYEDLDEGVLVVPLPASVASQIKLC